MKKTSTLLICLLFCALLLPGCGKKGNPIPQDAKNIFAWKGAKATRTTVLNNGEPQNCISIQADMTGAVTNVEAFLLELEPQTGEICRECPFTPTEVMEVKPIAAQEYQKTTRYTFSYCPSTQAATYRLRLVARNVFSAFPYELTRILTLATR